jgi:hypothetical protein
MSKKTILFFAAIIFFSSFRMVFAALAIDEIMYDLSGSDSVSGKSREWVEIYNPDSSDVSIDASKWRFYDGSGNRTINDEINFSIPTDSYVIFAGDKATFLADNPNFSGTVYDTGITSLNNTGATLKLLDQNGNVVDAVTYTSSEGGSGDGNSLQLINNSWVGAVPTPGMANQISQTSAAASAASVGSGALVADNSGENNSVGSTTSTTETKNNVVAQGYISTKILGKNLDFVGIPVALQAKAYGTEGEQLFFGKYFWNFGDGDSKEINLSDSSQPFSHTYAYPGDYVITLDYYSNPYQISPDASEEFDVKIIPADIVISKVGGQNDFFVELANNTDYDADISGWILQSNQKTFALPIDTILGSEKTITISPKFTDFTIADQNNLKLENKDGQVVFDYGATIGQVSPEQTQPPKPPLSGGLNTNSSLPLGEGQGGVALNSTHPLTSSQREGAGTIVFPQTKTSAKIPVKNLPIPSDTITASVISSPIAQNNSKNKNNLIIFIYSMIFIGISAGAAYFIRRKKVIAPTSSDFKILDE